MVAATQYRYRVLHGENTIETYTQEEAVEIARRLALESGSDIHIYDSDDKIKARVFLYDGKSYVDYYLSDRIAVCEIIVHGKPRIASARIPVNIILDYLAQGATIENLTSQAYYPDLTPEDILACIAYASSVIEQTQREPHA